MAMLMGSIACSSSISALKTEFLHISIRTLYTAQVAVRLDVAQGMDT